MEKRRFCGDIKSSRKGSIMQISLFENENDRLEYTKHVADGIVHSDIVRARHIADAIEAKDKERILELVELSCESYSFGNNVFSWGLGVLIVNKTGAEYEISPQEIADEIWNMFVKG